MKNGGARALLSILLSVFLIGSNQPLVFADTAESRSTIRQAYNLERHDQDEQAVQTLEAAMAGNPSDASLERACRVVHSRIAKKLFHHGFKLYRRGEFQGSIVYFDQALQHDPSFSKAAKWREASLTMLNKASSSKKETTPDLIEDGRGRRPYEADTRILMQEGRALLNEGKYDEAQAKFELILTRNPYHVPAKKYVDLILERRGSVEYRKQNISEEERMIEVRKDWLPPKKEKIIAEVELPWKVPVGVSEARKRLEQQSQQVIPNINFNNAHLSDVIKYLSKVSGINIIIDESVIESMTTPSSAPITASPHTLPAEGEEGASQGDVETATEEMAAAPESISDRVTISLKDVPLIESLKYILRAKGLRYMIEDYAIIIVAADYIPPEDYETRYYHLSSGVGAFTSFELESGTEEGTSLESEGGEGGSKVAETITIKDILEQSGVPWPEGSRIFLDQRTGTLIVRNTPTNLTIVEDILRTLDVAPYQVAITARFIELEHSNAEEMGLEWLLNDDLKYFLHEGSNAGLTPAGSLQRVQFDKLTKSVGSDTLNQTLSGNLRYFTTDPLTGQVSSSLIGEANPIVSFSGILTRPEFSVVLHALNQKTKNNVLSSPRVTTVNGQRAQIKLVQEFIYPTEYEVTPATTNSQGSVLTPAVVAPGSFETRDVGIVLDVTPNVGADRKTINLTIIPEVSEFVTWLDYGVPTQTFVGTDSVERTLPGYPILQPLFQTRTVTTSVIVNDGETVVLGGLIRDQINAFTDKIPFLGDIPLVGLLFKKKGEISVKKNLIIFVTAELITPSGDPYAPTQIESGEAIVPTDEGSIHTDVLSEAIVSATPVVQ